MSDGVPPLMTDQLKRFSHPPRMDVAPRLGILITAGFPSLMTVALWVRGQRSDALIVLFVGLGIAASLARDVSLMARSFTVSGDSICSDNYFGRSFDAAWLDITDAYRTTRRYGSRPRTIIRLVARNNRNASVSVSSWMNDFDELERLISGRIEVRAGPKWRHDFRRMRRHF